ATGSVPEGLSAAAAFNPMAGLDENRAAMEGAAGSVTAGAVTRALRDASTPAGEVREGDWLGLAGGDVTLIGDDPVAVAVDLLTGLRQGSHEILTVVAGADASEDDVARLE